SFNFVAPVEAQPVAGYSKDTREMTLSHDGQSVESAVAQTAHSSLPIWKRLLHDTTVTIGCNNVFGQDPPSSLTDVRYPAFLYDTTGRFVYLSLTKKF
ncbi:MAG: hypothetical protein M3Q86_04575, partial [Verrucomicrobiota bacterium]|nr:hypothetical protein [Verrucomicrobiota bacterium]